MSNFKYNVANETFVSPDDVSDWLDGLVRGRGRIIEFAKNAKSPENHTYILNSLDELSLKYKDTANALELLEIGRSETKADLSRMGLERIANRSKFSYKNDILYFEQMSKNIGNVANGVSESIASGSKVDYSVLNDVLKDGSLDWETNFKSINDKSYKDRLSADFKQLDTQRNKVKSKVRARGILPSEYCSIAAAEIERSDFNFDKDISKDSWRRMGITPVKEPFFDADKLHTLDIKSGVDETKAGIKKDLRLSINLDSFKEYMSRVGDQMLMYSGRPWANVWDNLKKLLGGVDWTFGYGQNDVAAAFVEHTGEKRKPFTLFRNGKFDEVDGNDLKHLEGLSVYQIEAKQKKDLDEIEAKINRGEKVNTLYFKEKESSERIIEKLLNKGARNMFLGSRDQKQIELHQSFLCVLEEKRKKNPYIVCDLQPSEVKELKFKALDELEKNDGLRQKNEGKVRLGLEAEEMVYNAVEKLRDRNEYFYHGEVFDKIDAAMNKSYKEDFDRSNLGVLGKAKKLLKSF